MYSGDTYNLNTALRDSVPVLKLLLSLQDLLNEGTVFLSPRLNFPNLKQVHN
jgi:hypothetical protein